MLKSAAHQRNRLAGKKTLTIFTQFIQRAGFYSVQCLWMDSTLSQDVIGKETLQMQVGPPSGVLKGKQPAQWRPKDVANTVLIDRHAPGLLTENLPV